MGIAFPLAQRSASSLFSFLPGTDSSGHIIDLTFVARESFQGEALRLGRSVAGGQTPRSSYQELDSSPRQENVFGSGESPLGNTEIREIERDVVSCLYDIVLLLSLITGGR